MFPQLWEDSVNIKQPLARQTRFQMGMCDPLAPALTRGLRGCPAVVMETHFVGGPGAWAL